MPGRRLRRGADRLRSPDAQKSITGSDGTRARVRTLRLADVGGHRQDARRGIGQERQNSPRWPHCRLSTWPGIAPHRFWPRYKAGDAHPMGGRRFGVLHHGYSGHHRLHASLAVVAGRRPLGRCLRTGPPITPAANWLTKKIEKDVRGPDLSTRDANPSWVWGEAKDARGWNLTIRIVTLNGYSLTVFSSLALAQHVMSNACPPGCGTPAALLGENFILSLP